MNISDSKPLISTRLPDFFRRAYSIETIYDNFAPYLFGLISRSFPQSHEAENTLAEVFRFISAHLIAYQPEKWTLLQWLTNCARKIIYKKLYLARCNLKAHIIRDDEKIFAKLVTAMRFEDGLSEIAISEELFINRAVIAYTLKK